MLAYAGRIHNLKDLEGYLAHKEAHPPWNLQGLIEHKVHHAIGAYSRPVHMTTL